VIDQTSIRAYSLSVFERTFRVTEALKVLTLAVAAIAMMLSLLTRATARLPELAPVWALGMAPRTLLIAESLRSVIMAVMTFVVALPVSLGLAWLLLNRLNVAAFGWKLPMHLFPLDWAVLLLWTVAAAILASLPPILRLRRQGGGAYLRVFAHGT